MIQFTSYSFFQTSFTTSTIDVSLFVTRYIAYRGGGYTCILDSYIGTYMSTKPLKPALSKRTTQFSVRIGESLAAEGEKAKRLGGMYQFTSAYHMVTVPTYR